MSGADVLVCLGALVAATLATGAIRRFALAHGVLDIPNARSSHRHATPRGGGAAVVVVVTVADVLLGVSGLLDARVTAIICTGALLVAGIGYLDDRYTVSAGVRLAVHVGAALVAVWLLDGLPALRVSEGLVRLGWIGWVLAVVGIVWTLNLFNFMDGIDAIAASEAVFVMGAGTLLTLVRGSGLQLLAESFAAACLGLLLWNWPPAKIFMGDVGSGYIGYVIAVIALAATRADPAAVWVWLILGGVFFVDATVTLIRRALRGEQAHLAHRSHAYQWLARRWRSHLKVTTGVLLINGLWLLPCAAVAARAPNKALLMVAMAFVPLIAIALWAGAGRSEPSSG